MSEDDNLFQEKPFCVEIAKQGRAVCKKCKQKCVQGDLRVAKLIPNPYGSGKMKTWHHVKCIFEMFLKQRQTTKRIEGPNDLEGWDLLSEDDKYNILKKIKECNKAFKAKLQSKSTKKSRSSANKTQQLISATLSDDSLSVSSDTKDGTLRDNCFREFRMIVANITNASSSSEKIRIFHNIFANGSDGTGFKGDIVLWCKLLLPGVIKRVFHLDTKQLIKIFSKIFHVNEVNLLEHLDEDDAGLTIQHFFEQNKKCVPLKKSTLTIHDVDEFLETLTTLTKEDEQLLHFKSFVKNCTGNDLKVVIRLIKHDLRMNAGAIHVFEGLQPGAYQIFQNCRDVKTVINTCWRTTKKEKSQNKISENPKPTKRSPKRKFNESKINSKKIKTEDIKSDFPEIEILPLTQTKIENVELKEINTETPQILDNTSIEAIKPVRNYFENIKLCLEDGVSERHAEWVKCFIDCGGIVLESSEHEQVTHVLHLKDTIKEPTVQCVNSARHVIVEWIKDSVAKECLQDFRPYTVRWNPSCKN